MKSMAQRTEVRRKTEAYVISGKSTPSLEEIMKLIHVNSGLLDFSFEMRYLPEKEGWQITITEIYC